MYDIMISYCGGGGEGGGIFTIMSATNFILWSNQDRRQRKKSFSKITVITFIWLLPIGELM